MTKKTRGTKKSVTSNKHADAKRAYLPTPPQAVRVPELHLKDRKSMATKNRAEHETRLDWKRANKLEELEIDVKTIFIHERIHPEQLAKSIQRQVDKEVLPLFGTSFNGIEKGTEYKFYQHANWQNRLIHGNSVEVMASLLDKEPRTMAGQVQCIYFDPPFGINFDGFRRPKEDIDAVGVSEGRGEQSTVSYRAFVDSYVRVDEDGTIVKGLPAYLDGIYRVCALGRQLLKESGSMFVQISNTNLHRVALIMDEVFGESNRMQLIKYQTGSTASESLGRSGDYLLWYAKDKELAVKSYNQLYIQRSKAEYLAESQSFAIGRHAESKQIRNWSQLESKYNGAVPKEWELGRKSVLISQHAGAQLQSVSWPRCTKCPMGPGCEKMEDCIWASNTNGKKKSSYRDLLPNTFNVRPGVSSPDPGAQWRVNNPDGLDRLADNNRLCTSVRKGDGTGDGVRNVRELIEKGGGRVVKEDVHSDGGFLQWIMLYSEDPGKKLLDNWEGGRVGTNKKLFVVQTPEKFIERCILMTTKPGDLVLDPTCGSGTTAVVAERYGRRWITADAGAWQIAVARERLTTVLFDEYLLRGTEEGRKKDADLDKNHGTGVALKNPVKPYQYMQRDPAQGFVYDRRPKVSAGSLSREEAMPDITLVDRPIVANGGKNRRVCSSFTVERLAPYDVVNSVQVSDPVTVSEVSRRAETNLDGHRIFDTTIEGIEESCPLVEESNLTHRCEVGGERSAMWIAQPSETVSEYRINKAADEAKRAGYKNLVVAAFGYEDAMRPTKLWDEGIRIWCLVLPISLTISEAEAKKSYPPRTPC